ncbi:MAG: AglZ/HisF2 family acetamidino modification protein [Bernardetiaceae bacterium]
MKRPRIRVIPMLLLKKAGLYKTVKFKDPKYVGDPINALKIFNEKEVDEMVFLDITASRENHSPNIGMLADIASECFMPLCYGGGITSVDMMREVLHVGVEKIALNTQAVLNPSLITEAAQAFGSSTVVVSIDAKKTLFGGYQVFIRGGQEKTKLDPVAWAKEVERLGAGEILINAIDLDGTMKGYDLKLIKSVAEAVNIPVIAAGGAGSLSDFRAAVREGGASAVGAGSFFVFQGKHRAVLITYPTPADVLETFGDLV